MTSTQLSDLADIHDTYLSSSKYRDIKLKLPTGQSPPKDVSDTTKPATLETVLYQMRRHPGKLGIKFLYDWQKSFKKTYLTSDTYRNCPISNLKLIILGSSPFRSTPFPFVSLESSPSKVPHSTWRFLKLIHAATGQPAPTEFESKHYDFQCLGARPEVFFYNICFDYGVNYAIQFLNLLISNSQISENLVLLDFRNPKVVALPNLSVCFGDEFRNHRDYWTYKGETPPAKTQSLNQLQEMYYKLEKIDDRLNYEDKNIDDLSKEKLDIVQTKVNEIGLAIEVQLSLLKCITGKSEDYMLRIEQDQLAFLRHTFAEDDEDWTVVTNGKVKYFRIGDLGNALWTERDFDLAVKRLKEVGETVTEVFRKMYKL